MKIDEQWECWTLCEIKTEGTYRGEEGPTPETTACPEAGKVKARKKEKKMCTDVHAYHTYVSGVLLFLFASCKSSQGWPWFKENMPEKKLNTDRWKNMPRLYPKGHLQNASLKQNTRGTPQHNASAHESLSCTNRRTTTAASSRKKQYQSVVPLYYRYEYHTAAAVVVST